MSSADLRAALWGELVERSEAFHDAVVRGQRRANLRTATKLENSADELLALTKTILLTKAKGAKS